MITADDIRNRIAAYILGQMPLDDFEDWLASNSWNVQNLGHEVRELALAVEARLAEHSGGYIDEDSLRASLSGFVHSYAVDIGEPIHVNIQTGSSGTPVVTDAALPLELADIRSEVELV